MNALSLDGLIAKVNATFASLPDTRTGNNTQYALRDAVLGAFSVFMMQSPSFLAHQRDLERRKGWNNVTRLFGVDRIPSDPQIRNLLDGLEPAHLYETFWWVWEQVRSTRYAEQFRGVNGTLLCALDGTQYFSSKKIHCPQCSQRQLADGTRLYTHTMIAPVLVGPTSQQVLSLDPEFITPQDGAEKQDCERAAFKRWLVRNGTRLAAESATILTDDLHCNQPACQLLLDYGLNFILVCKPDSHPTLYEEIALLAKLDEVNEVRVCHWNGKFHEQRHYRFVNALPLRAGEDALYVNWCEVIIAHAETGERLYYNTFATNFLITPENMAEIAHAGRARWKVENENHNVLKRYGYHLEHNFGHGQAHLAAFLVTLNLLAFLVHTVLQLTHRLYQLLRQALGTRQTFFQDLRTLLRYHHFATWHQLFTFMCQGLELELPDEMPNPLPP